MAELAAIQRTFYARVTSGGDTDAIVASGDLGIYTRMYESRLHDTLAADYPKVRTVLGDDGFAEMVMHYLEAHPPRSYTLRDAGLELPGFLAATTATSVAELARLERARIEAFDAPDASPLCEDEVVALDLGLPELELRLVPSSVVITLAWAVDDMWSAIDDGEPSLDASKTARTVLVWRRGIVVLHRTLELDEAEIVPRLATGIAFAEVCELLAARHGEQAAARATELLLRWLRAEILVA